VTEHRGTAGSNDRRKLTRQPRLLLVVLIGSQRIGTGGLDRRLANQTFYDRIDISEDERATIRLAEPFAALTPEPTSTDVRCSSTSSWVGPEGLEPPTSTV
jgi:hypothetical protein